MRTPLVLLCLSLLGCGNAGEWVDDPDNLSRAWGKSAATGIKVVHSYYWRSSHFTREEILFFQFAPAPGLRAGLVQANGLVPTNSDAILSTGFCRPRPAWFAPQSPDSYSAWAPPPSELHIPLRLFLLEERSSGALFIYCCQL